MNAKPFSNADGTSTYEDSDVEHLSFASEMTEMRDEVSYCFGQKYFDCVISQQVLQDCSPYDTPSEVDSRLFCHMRDFPYDRCLASLAEIDSVERPNRFQVVAADPRTRMLILVGWIIHEGSARAKQQMLQTVRTLHQDQRGKSRDGKRSRSASGSCGPELPTARSAPTNPGVYSMAVNNHGMKIGAKPLYSSEHMSADPNLFKTVMTFMDRTFEGKAASSKLAQHEAAKQACSFFKLQV
ncbi:hypothetical protein A1O7_06732 [Cladophialophora yegresii CBS 114405]|uniref:Uncharacterized protein n=1 Tax=Cladophialophora yegresii CBS 114405 TaxID=1182544 RepID=W9WCZ2_9EURO|nr:uncharacterized protein A1O7_06732 [Cladophialophora yegresii CBS 114405]EXJ56389.1 hypothetical protein A1O7_06732 [Cladophialophora yegresii CBS 114405]